MQDERDWNRPRVQHMHHRDPKGWRDRGDPQRILPATDEVCVCRARTRTRTRCFVSMARDFAGFTDRGLVLVDRANATAPDPGARPARLVRHPRVRDAATSPPDPQGSGFTVPAVLRPAARPHVGFGLRPGGTPCSVGCCTKQRPVFQRSNARPRAVLPIVFTKKLSLSAVIVLPAPRRLCHFVIAAQPYPSGTSSASSAKEVD